MVVVRNTLIAQLILIFFQSFVAFFILQLSDPFKSESQRKMEIFNESILLIVAYTIICFSAWIPNIETKFKIGYVSVGFVTIHLIVNFSLITYSTIKTYIRKCRVQKATKTHN